MAKSILLLLFMLAGHVSTEPYQCAELRAIIPACSCAARVWKGTIIIDQVVIDCRNIAITKVPQIMGSSEHIIYEMTLAQNGIQTIPAEAFRGLKIQRIDLRKNPLTTFNTTSFHGLENILKELYLGAEKGADVLVPIDSLVALDSMTTLHLEYFKIPDDALDPGLLDRLTDLKSLTLRHNGLFVIEPHSLPSNLTSLTLDYQSLRSFPNDQIRHLLQLESLTVRNTDIAEVTQELFKKNTKLAYLDLSNNKINTLSDRCFEGITSSLKNLSLKDNRIPSVNTLEEIKELTALTTLDLSGTTLSSLPTGASFLLNKESLTVLNLDRNNLTTLGPDVFSQLSGLKELHLAYNQLASWDDQVFAGLSSLQYLDISHQNPTQGHSLDMPESLSSLTSLQTLTLSRTTVNPAKLWPRIGPMSSLQTLFLDSVSLDSIPDYALINLTQLQELNLNGNSLTNITQPMLAGLRGLRMLTVSGNRIMTIGRCAFYGFYFSANRALTLEFHTNPLNCDCKLKWLLEERDAGNISLLREAEECATPDDKKGLYLNNFQPSDLTCVIEPAKESCLELYTTPPPPFTTPAPSSTHNLTIANVNVTSVTVSWTAVPNISAPYLEVLVLNLNDPSDTRLPERTAADDTSYRVTNLKSGTQYSVCILAIKHKPTCVTTETLSDSSAEDLDDGDEDNVKEIGIIVGTIVAVLVLAAVIAAILYLLVCRRRSSKEVGTPPHVFAPGELPTMTPDSKHFAKPREKPPPKVGRALDEVKVTVISDGQTAPVSPRHSVGSYQFLDKDHPNPNPGMVPKDYSAYNNMDARALPSVPGGPPSGYYNMDGSSHPYNEIEKE